MLAYFCKHRFLLSPSPAIPTQCGGVHKMKVTTQPVPLRPERAEAPSPGHRPGLLRTQTCRPERAKALKYWAMYKAFALTGALLIAIIPRALPWARSFCPFRACGAYLIASVLYLSLRPVTVGSGRIG